MLCYWKLDYRFYFNDPQMHQEEILSSMFKTIVEMRSFTTVIVVLTITFGTLFFLFTVDRWFVISEAAEHEGLIGRLERKSRVLVEEFCSDTIISASVYHTRSLAREILFFLLLCFYV